MTKLIVDQAFEKDVYRDIARVHEDNRGGIREGKICYVEVAGGRGRYLAIRGLPNRDRGKIRLDDVTRDALELNDGDVKRFKLRKANPIEAMMWAAQASDPAARVATWIAIWSLVIGLVVSAWSYFAAK